MGVSRAEGGVRAGAEGRQVWGRGEGLLHPPCLQPAAGGGLSGAEMGGAQAQSPSHPESTAGSARTPWSPLCAPEGMRPRVCRTRCVTFLVSPELQFPRDHCT